MTTDLIDVEVMGPEATHGHGMDLEAMTTIVVDLEVAGPEATHGHGMDLEATTTILVDLETAEASQVDIMVMALKVDTMAMDMDAPITPTIKEATTWNGSSSMPLMTTVARALSVN